LGRLRKSHVVEEMILQTRGVNEFGNRLEEKALGGREAGISMENLYTRMEKALMISRPGKVFSNREQGRISGCEY